MALVLGTALFTVLPALVSAQENGGLPRSIEIRPLSSFAPSENTIPLALGDAALTTVNGGRDAPTERPESNGGT